MFMQLFFCNITALIHLRLALINIPLCLPSKGDDHFAPQPDYDKETAQTPPLKGGRGGCCNLLIKP